MSDIAPALLPDELQVMLRALLDGAGEGGKLAPSVFWQFAAALAQGRGIGAELHSAGLEAAHEVGKKQAKATNADQRKAAAKQQRRAYHIGFTAQLLLDVGGLPGSGSIFPTNYDHGAVLSEFFTMLGGPDGLGAGDLQMLTSARGGQDVLRDYARRRLVGVTLWRIGSSGQTRAAVWRDLMGEFDEKTKYDRWLKALGGHKGAFALAALAAGQRGDVESDFAATNTELEKVIALVNGAQGPKADNFDGK